VLNRRAIGHRAIAPRDQARRFKLPARTREVRTLDTKVLCRSRLLTVGEAYKCCPVYHTRGDLHRCPTSGARPRRIHRHHLKVMKLSGSLDEPAQASALLRPPPSKPTW
jgi:hypothetical protein